MSDYYVGMGMIWLVWQNKVVNFLVVLLLLNNFGIAFVCGAHLHLPHLALLPSDDEITNSLD